MNDEKNNEKTEEIKDIVHDMRDELCGLSGYLEIFQIQNKKEAERFKIMTTAMQKLADNLAKLEQLIQRR